MAVGGEDIFTDFYEMKAKQRLEEAAGGQAERDEARTHVRQVEVEAVFLEAVPAA